MKEGWEPGGQGSTPALAQAGGKWEGAAVEKLEGHVRARHVLGARTEGLWGDHVGCLCGFSSELRFRPLES